MLNKKLIQYNLEEAQEEIEGMLEKVKSPGEYSETAYLHSMQHLIHHINIAWNARSVAPDDFEKTGRSQWSHFPTDLKLI